MHVSCPPLAHLQPSSDAGVLAACGRASATACTRAHALSTACDGTK